MDQGVVALVIVSGLAIGIGCFVIAGLRTKQKRRREIEDVVRSLGGLWASPGSEIQPALLQDPLSGSPYSNTEQSYDRAFWAEYRGRPILGLEHTVRSWSHSGGNPSARRTKHHLVKVLDVELPHLVLRPQLNIPTETFPGLTTMPSGVPEFDDRYDVRASDTAAAARVITPAVHAWLLQREGSLAFVSSPSGLESAGSGVLPGWATVATANDLCDLAQYGAIRPGPRLQQQSAPPPGNRVLNVIGGVLCVAALVFWITMFTISDPSGGLVVIGVIAGLAVVGITLERLLNRRARHKRQAPGAPKR